MSTPDDSAPPPTYTVTLTCSEGPPDGYTCTAQHWKLTAAEHAWLALKLATILETPPTETHYSPTAAEILAMLAGPHTQQVHPERGHLLERPPMTPPMSLPTTPPAVLPFPHQHTDGPLTGCELLDPDD